MSYLFTYFAFLLVDSLYLCQFITCLFLNKVWGDLIVFHNLLRTSFHPEHCGAKNPGLIVAYITAVKSNALAELMNRASKIHWKNLSLTLNGRNSETKNYKNNPKVPKFSSCRGLSSTLSRKCGSTTLCGCLWVFCGCLWVFLGVCGC